MREEGKLIKAPPISEKLLRESIADFQKHFKPLFEEMDRWRKESAASPTRVY